MNLEQLRAALDAVLDFTDEQSGFGYPNVPALVSGNEVYDAFQPVRGDMPRDVANAWKKLKRLSREAPLDPLDFHSAERRTRYEAREEFGKLFIRWATNALNKTGDSISTGAASSALSKIEKDNLAVALLLEDSSRTQTEIARRIGVERSALRHYKQFQKALAALKSTRKEFPRESDI